MPVVPEGIAIEIDRERAAYEQVMASGIFSRSPGVAKVFRYVCEKHFAGEDDSIREYNIAVEALGRSIDFDQRKDSIVRVEAHRMRKRLAEYYAGAGAGDSVRIEIPPGSYVPQFLRRDGDVAMRVPAAIVPEVLAPGRRTNRRGWLWLSASGAVAAAGTWVWSRDRGTAGPAPALAPPPGDEVRILVGSTASKYVDRSGNVWTGDRYFSGGQVQATPAATILRTLDPAIYQTQRRGGMSYAIPLRPGYYELRLHFAEKLYLDNQPLWTNESPRIFDIYINGERVARQFEVLADAGGPHLATTKVFAGLQPGGDGLLRVELRGGNSTLSGIEVVPSLADGKMLPVRIAARMTPFTDSAGRDWSADRCFVGGRNVLRSDDVAGTKDPELYRGERFGSFTYTIAVARGRRHTASLHFCENYFGKGRPGGGGVGSRVFDVDCNGRKLLRRFDIVAEAEALRAVTRTFPDLEPTAQGKLVFTFVPVANYALINAIEVTES